MVATRQDVLDSLVAQRDRLKRLGVRKLSLFGSAARDQLSDQSDLDVLVELAPKTFDGYMDVKFLLEDSLGRRVDLVLLDALKPRLRAAILKDRIDVEGF
jgi:predicted nucleotidyltransferase